MFASLRQHLRDPLTWTAVSQLLKTTLGHRDRVGPRRAGVSSGASVFGAVGGIAAGVMMVCYVVVPARLIGDKPVQSRRDKLATRAVGGERWAPPFAPRLMSSGASAC
jgi:hypothetical protein